MQKPRRKPGLLFSSSPGRPKPKEPEMSKYSPPAHPARPDTRRCLTSSNELAWRKCARGFTLHLHKNRGPALLSVVPDSVCPGMWRVERPDGSLSDLVNLARAKDAAIALTLGLLNRQKRDQETALEAPRARQKHWPGVSAAPGPREGFWRAAR
jgi:hypothetical protein